MIFVLECEGAVIADAAGEIRIAAGNQDQITLKTPVGADRTGTIDTGVETIVSSQKRQRRAFGQQLGCRAGSEQFVGIDSVNDFALIKRIELNAEQRMFEFGPIHDGLNSLRQRLRWYCGGIEDQ